MYGRNELTDTCAHRRWQLTERTERYDAYDVVRLLWRRPPDGFPRLRPASSCLQHTVINNRRVE